MASQPVTTQTTTLEQKEEMNETLTLVLRLRDRIENKEEPPTAAEEEEIVRRFSDLAAMLSAGAVISGDALLVVGHILEVADLVKYGLDMSLIGAPLMLVHLALRFWLLRQVSQTIRVSESMMDQWNEQYNGRFGELPCAEAQARECLERLRQAVAELVASKEGNVATEISMRLRAAVLATEQALTVYDEVICRSQRELKVVLGHTEDSKARAQMMYRTSVTGVVGSTAVVGVSIAAIVATGGIAAIVGAAVGVVGAAGNGFAANQSGKLVTRAEDVLVQIEEGQALIDGHRKKFEEMTQEIKKIIEKGEDTIRREKAFLIQRHRSEVAEAARKAAEKAQKEAEANAAKAEAAAAAKDAELEQLRRMMARLQAQAKSTSFQTTP